MLCQERLRSKFIPTSENKEIPLLVTLLALIEQDCS
jgi:hypothetical protein